LITALPWTKVWGGSFEYLRNVGQKAEVAQDWTTGPASAKARRIEDFVNAPPGPAEASNDEHAQHRMMHHHAGDAPTHAVIAGFDEIAALVLPLRLADPILISPPSPERRNWVARSDAQNRPLRTTLEFEPGTFEQVKESPFSERPLIDRVIGVGVAAHEGQLFGWFNQFLGLLTACGYLTLVVTSTLMWWRRRPLGALGAPPAFAPRPKLAPFVIGGVVLLGVLLPTLGVSLLFVLVAEQAIRRFAPRAARWLGLTSSLRRGGRDVARA